MMSKKVDFEKLVKSIMIEYEKDGTPVTREEAEEVAKMEIKAGNVKNYVKSEKPKAETAKGKKPPKPDPAKESLIQEVADFLKGFPDAENVTIVNKTRELNFNFKNENFSFVLTRHKKK